jgi:SAM-dependent methyltransferase
VTEEERTVLLDLIKKGKTSAIGQSDLLRQEITSWEATRNGAKATINWRFTTTDARREPERGPTDQATVRPAEDCRHVKIPVAFHWSPRPDIRRRLESRLVMATSYNYDTTWPDFDDMKRFGPMSRHARRLTWSFVRNLDFTSVLDVGCGQGSPLEYIAQKRRGVELCGVDISFAAVELARHRLPTATFTELDLTRQALPRTFDLVICSDVLEHIEEDRAALRNIRSMTGRWFLVSTIQGHMRSFEPTAVGHVRNYAPGELRSKMEEAGFRIVRQVDWGFPLYSPLYRNLCDRAPISVVQGTYGFGRRMLARLLYLAFFLNLPVWGDYLWIIAEPV